MLLSDSQAQDIIVSTSQRNENLRTWNEDEDLLDQRMESMGFTRSGTQPSTEPDGNCALRAALGINVNILLSCYYTLKAARF